MRVGQLAIILDHVDPDLPIILRGGSRGAVHPAYVVRSVARHVEGFGPVTPSLAIESRWNSPLWFEADPGFELLGPFLRRALLEERLGWR